MNIILKLIQNSWTYILFGVISLLIFSFLGPIKLLIAICIPVLVLTLFLFYKRKDLPIYVLLISMILDSFIAKGNSYSGFTILTIEISTLLFMFHIFISVLVKSWDKYQVSVIGFVWILFLIYSLSTGLLVSLDKYRMLTFWKNYFIGYLVFLYVINFTPGKHFLLKYAYSLIVWGVCLVCVQILVLNELGGFDTGILGLVLKKNLMNIGWGRSNYISAFFVLIIPICLGLILFEKSILRKGLLFFSLLFLVTGIMLTLSRGGFIALFIGMLTFMFLILEKRYIIPISSSIIVVSIVLLFNPLTSVLFEGLSTLEKSGSVYSRINFYVDTWNAFLSHPITGVGFGNLGLHSVFILPIAESPSAHNIILGALGEVGFVGAVLYLTVLLLIVYRAYNSFQNEIEPRNTILLKSFFAAIIGSLSHTLVEPTLEGIQFTILFFLVCGISVSYFTDHDGRKVVF